MYAVLELDEIQHCFDNLALAYIELILLTMASSKDHACIDKNHASSSHN
jgi:hypothetical protein